MISIDQRGRGHPKRLERSVAMPIYNIIRNFPFVFVCLPELDRWLLRP